MKETLFDDALEVFQKGCISPINLINLFDEYRIATPVTSPTNNKPRPESVNKLSKYIEKINKL